MESGLTAARDDDAASIITAAMRLNNNALIITRTKNYKNSK
jgi:hypothetical protein